VNGCNDLRSRLRKPGSIAVLMRKKHLAAWTSTFAVGASRECAGARSEFRLAAEDQGRLPLARIVHAFLPFWKGWTCPAFYSRSITGGRATAFPIRLPKDSGKLTGSGAKARAFSETGRSMYGQSTTAIELSLMRPVHGRIQALLCRAHAEEPNRAAVIGRSSHRVRQAGTPCSLPIRGAC
jgi:hypothetical protein